MRTIDMKSNHLFGPFLSVLLQIKQSPSPTLVRIIYKSTFVDYSYTELQKRKQFILKRYKGKFVCMTHHLQRDDGSIVLILVLDDVYHEYPSAK